MHVSVSILSPNQRLIYTEISGGLWNWIKMVAHGYKRSVSFGKSVQCYFFYKCTMVYILSNTWNTIRVLKQNGKKNNNLTSNIQYIKRGGALTCYIKYTHLI